MLVSHSLSGWSFPSYWKKNGVVIMIHTIPEILSTWIATKESFGIIPVPEKIAEELDFERREEPAYEVNDKRNLLH